MAYGELRAIGCYRRRRARQEPRTGREGSQAPLLPLGMEQQLQAAGDLGGECLDLPQGNRSQEL